jgi:hypothetical protein
MNNLDLLLSDSYSKIIEKATIIESLRQQRQQASSNLSCAIVSTNILCRVLVNMTEAQASLLMSYMSPVIDDDSESTWEEMTLASTAHLLRTCLSKKSQQSPLNVQTEMEPLENTEKLKKQIHAVYERLLQGAQINE